MGLPLTVFGTGGYTPGAETALNAAVELINTSWTEAESKSAAYTSKIGSLGTAIPALVIDPLITDSTGLDITAGTAASATIVEPTVDIPAVASTADVMTLFDTKYLELVAMLSDKFTAFQTAHFPNDATDYLAAETFMLNALGNNSGLPEAVRAQMMTDASNAIYADASRASDAVLQQFAARRFPLPPGAAASAVLQIQQKAQDGVAEAGRKITIASVEQLRWAAEKVLSLRGMAMGSALDYIKALASGPDMASRVVSIGYDAQSKLISAASQFYGARAEVAKITNQVEQFNVTTALQAEEKNQTKDMMVVESRLKILLSEAQALAQMATALYNNLHVSAGTGYNVSVS